MANRSTGETTYTVDGKVYRLKLGNEAMAKMEEIASVPDRSRFFDSLLSLVGRIGAASSDAERHKVLTTTTQAILEERQNARTDHLRIVTHTQVLALAQSGSWKYQRILVWASLQKHHPEITLEEAGEIMLESAEAEMAKAIADLGTSATPDPEDLKALGVKPANPLKAQTKKRGRPKTTSGTGENSTATDGASV